MNDQVTGASKRHEDRGAVGSPVERPVRPSLLTEKELLEIVDALIRDRAFNRPAAVAIAMAVGAAVEAEVRERCAKLCDQYADDAGPLDDRVAVMREMARRIRGA